MNLTFPKIPRRFSRSRVKGSSLFFASVFAIVVLSLAFLIQLSQNGYFYLFSNYAEKKSLTLLVQSAALVDRSDSVPTSGSIYRVLDVFHDGESLPVAITHQRWGAFEVQKVYGQSGHFSRRKAFLLGQSYFYQANGRSLYLADMDKPLIIAGATRIEGKAVVPNDGLFPGNIDGHYYQSKNLVEGAVSPTSAALPSLDGGLLEFWKQCSAGAIQGRDSIVALDPGLLLKGPATYSFFGPTALFMFQGAAGLNGVSLKGNAMVVSTDHLVIPSSCTLDNVVAVARKITVERGFRGRVQLFASDTIAIEEGVFLDFPSVAMVAVAPSAKGKGALTLGKGSVLSGALVFSDERSRDIFSLSAADLAAGSTVNGVVYCSGLLNLSGKVYGTVYTSYFYVKRYSGFYINYLVDAEISINKLSPHYCAPFVVGEGYRKEVVEELW